MTPETAPTPGFADRLKAALARVPTALWVLVGVGVALRIALELSYRPAVLTFADSIAYINMAAGDMFAADAARTVGYGVFLGVVHTVSANITVTILLQHLIGVVTGILVYASVRRVGAPVWVGLIGGAAVLLSLDQIYLEHAIASESVFTFLFIAALYACVRALEPARQLRGALTTRWLWLLAAGLLLGASAWVRGASAPLIPFLALWVLLAIPGPWKWRFGRAALAVAPAVAMMLVYFSLNSAQTGNFGLIHASGWGMYSRTAQFADCSKFTPPEGTEELCETKPPSERPGPDFYSWQPDSPAQKAFGPPPTANDRIGEFGRAVIKAQPVDYARAVGNDFVRYFFPGLNPTREYATAGYDLLEITRRDRVVEEDVRENSISNYFDPVDPVQVTGFAGTLSDIQQVLRVHPLLLFQAAILALLGIIWGRGRTRAGIVLLGGSSILMLGVAASTTYNARYAIPIDGPMVAAGAIGLWVVLERQRARRRRTAQAGEGGLAPATSANASA